MYQKNMRPLRDRYNANCTDTEPAARSWQKLLTDMGL